VAAWTVARTAASCSACAVRSARIPSRSARISLAQLGKLLVVVGALLIQLSAQAFGGGPVFLGALGGGVPVGLSARLRRGGLAGLLLCGLD
jgi:hypothetical protein